MSFKNPFTKEAKIEIFFWLVAAFVFCPRILLEVYEHKLKNILTPFENNEWTVKDKDGNVIYDKLTLPYDLRWKEQKTGRREWVFEKEVRTDQLKNTDDLGIVLGRVGDSDFVMFNDCMIGSTTFNVQTKQKEGWAWSHLRTYRVPKECITTPVSKLTYSVFKFYGPGYGVFAGPFGFGSFYKIHKNSSIIHFFKYTILSIFGLGLIFFVGIQYLFVYLVSERREIYGIFALLSISTGLYLFMTSTYPFLIAGNVSFPVGLIFCSAFLSALFFLKFFQIKFGVFQNKYFYTYVILGGLLLLASLCKKNPYDAYIYYEYWHPVFLISFLICFFQLIASEKNKLKSMYPGKYILAFAIFILCCFHDVFVSAFSYPDAYFIGYGFTFFVLVVGLTLSREYADAFTNIEDQVLQRTKDLNKALLEIQTVQKLKNDQARRFSHDMQSPLAALKVLKEIISPNIAEDLGSLLKQTITRINDLSNTTLPKLFGSVSLDAHESEAVFLWPLMDKLVSQKRVEYKNTKNFSIDILAKGNVFEFCSKCNETELARTLSNLINNSVEAMDESRPLSIKILFEKIGDTIQIQIHDSGKGISSEMIHKVFEENFTHGKSGGMGIGLTSAKKTVETWGGALSLESTIGVGTVITIQLKETKPPQWLLTSLNLSNIQNLVVIDDQSYVVEAWKQKMRGLSYDFKIFWVKNMDAWDQSDADLDKMKTMYLVDQDLGSVTTGLDMIEKLKLRPHVVLVTGNDDDLGVRKKAMQLGIYILPKALIHSIPIVSFDVSEV